MNLEEMLMMAKKLGVGDSVMRDSLKEEDTLTAMIRADTKRTMEIEELKRRVTKAEGPHAPPSKGWPPFTTDSPWEKGSPPPFIPHDKIDAGKYWGGITATGTAPVTITVDELIEMAKNKDEIEDHLKKKPVKPAKKDDKPMTQNELTGSW